MNKADLIEAVEARLGGKKAAAEAVDAIFERITRELVKGDGKVLVSGFGSWETVDRAARVGRNPRTGERVKVKKTTVVRFKPGSTLKACVAKPSLLPKESKPAAKPAPKKATAKPAGRKPAAKKAAPAKKTATKRAAAKTLARGKRGKK